MEKSITIHRTVEEEPPKFGRFIVGRKENGENIAMPCRYSRCQESWNVGEHYWNQSDLAKLWPFWTEIPDFEEIPIKKEQPLILPGFPEDEKLPETFNVEDLIQLKYKTDVQSILRRILMEFGTEIDGKLLYPLIIPNPDKEIPKISENIPLVNQSKTFLAIITNKTDKQYKNYLPNEVHIYKLYDADHKFYCQKMPYSFKHIYEKQILNKIQRTIIRIQKDYPEIRLPHHYDPEYGFGTKITSINELHSLGWITSRAANGLDYRGIRNVSDLNNLSISKLKDTREVGKITLQEILNFYKKLGITLEP